MQTLDDQSIGRTARSRYGNAAAAKSKSKSLSLRAKQAGNVQNPKARRPTTVELGENSKSNNDELQRILQNLHIRFTNCTFTYKPSHLLSNDCTTLEDNDGTPRRPKRSFFSKVKKGISSRLAVATALDCDTQFEKCLFVPINEEQMIKDFIRSQFPYPKITFYNCKFIQRPSTLMEQIARKVRTILGLGIVFELAYVFSQVTIEESLFRIKDLSFITSYVQEEIADKA